MFISKLTKFIFFTFFFSTCSTFVHTKASPVRFGFQVAGFGVVGVGAAMWHKYSRELEVLEEKKWKRIVEKDPSFTGDVDEFPDTPEEKQERWALTKKKWLAKAATVVGVIAGLAATFIQKGEVPDTGFKQALNRIVAVQSSKSISLDLSELDLLAVPPQIGQLKDLVELYLSDNELKKLLPQIGNLPNLRYLNLSNNNPS